MTVPVYNVSIQKVEQDTFKPSFARFKVLRQKHNEVALQVLVECNSFEQDPKIQAFWHVKKNKIYLMGGKDTSACSYEDKMIFKFDDKRTAWIAIDLKDVLTARPRHPKEIKVCLIRKNKHEKEICSLL